MEFMFTSNAPTTPLPEASTAQYHQIVSLIRQIREVFELYFDRSWLSIVIDELPLDRRTVREIREFVSLSNLLAEDDQVVEAGIDGLRRYIWTVRNHLLPHVKELLGVSPFSPERRNMDKSQYVLRRLTALTLPQNLEKLEQLVDSLETRLRDRRSPENTLQVTSIDSSSMASGIGSE
jgi:hypothetical protein